MSIVSILIIGGILLACGCGGLLIVRFDNPRLLGLGWLGAALGTGGAGALLLLHAPLESPLIFILLADVLILTCFVLLHLAVMEVVNLRGVPTLSLLLLILQVAADLVSIYGQALVQFRIVVTGILIAAQAAYTVTLLLRRAAAAIRLQAHFISVVLVGFILWNLFRSFAIATDLFANRTLAGQALAGQVRVLTYVLYLAVALGVAFGFFWMTTAGLTARLEDLARTDPLTRVLNRRAFDLCFQKEFQRAQRASSSFALVMLDLDHFKEVNDRYGHITGDEVLCAAVQNIQNATRGIDIIGRWGGEEFAILLPEANADTAQIVAQRIRGNIQKPAPLDKHLQHIPMTASLGVAVFRSEDTVEEVLRRADEALYRAKSAGRNCVITAPAEPPVSSVQLSLVLGEPAHS